MSLAQHAADQVAVLLQHLGGEEEDGVGCLGVQCVQQIGQAVPVGAAEGQIDGHVACGDGFLHCRVGAGGGGGDGAGGGGRVAAGVQAAVILPQAHVQQILRRLDEFGVGQDHCLVLDAQQIALADGVIGTAESEEGTHGVQGHIGPPVAHDGPHVVIGVGGQVPAGPGV